MKHDVFLSHSSKDKKIADAICSRLENNHIRCWIAPRDILPGETYGKAIINAINNCKIVIVIFSSHSDSSDPVSGEIERAFSKGKIIIPFRIENVTPSGDLELFLSRSHWLDAMTPPLEAHIDKLSNTILKLLPETETTTPLPEILPQKRIANNLQSAPLWKMRTTTGPGKRRNFGMIYNDRMEGIILQGGFGTGNDDRPFSIGRLGPELDDTWIWDGKSWQEMEANYPGLYSHSLAYYKSKKQCLIYGGSTGGTLFLPNEDTYLLDGKSWIKADTNNELGPKKRTDHTTAYDGKRGSIILFGGYSKAPGVHFIPVADVVSGETWEFDGSGWEKLHVEGPEPRCGHQMVYDEGNGVIVLFGGYNKSDYFNDTWLWEGNSASWSKMDSGNKPSARYNHAMTYDCVNKKVLLFGGKTLSDVPLNDLWEWNGSDWKLLVENAPPKPRFGHGFVYDEKRNKTILFGGYDGKEFFQDTWEFTY